MGSNLPFSVIKHKQFRLWNVGYLKIKGQALVNTHIKKKA